MRKTIFAIFLMAMVAGAVAAHVSAEGTEKKNVTNKMCPVSGGPVSEKYRTEYKGQFVYVCCEGCLTSFNKTPDEFVAKMSKEERELIAINETCPISKEPIDQANAKSLESEGRKVYFCCDGCVSKYKKEHPSAK
ncbi:MAG TPA: hypothetical protein VFF31_08950 [Blastocatellia bacterium]|nr:hypothetical protein [Blastocatellia bacterium]